MEGFFAVAKRPVFSPEWEKYLPNAGSASAKTHNLWPGLHDVRRQQSFDRKKMSDKENVK